ncbi:helix-turn-helix domain-containing protein [Bacillaceae bacterium]
MTKIGKTIKKLRQDRNLLQKDLAARVQISRSALAKYESGERTPDIETLIKIADAFGISLDELVGRQQFKREVIREVQALYETKRLETDWLELMLICEKDPQMKIFVKKLGALTLAERHRILRIVDILLEND